MADLNDAKAGKRMVGIVVLLRIAALVPARLPTAVQEIGCGRVLKDAARR